LAAIIAIAKNGLADQENVGFDFALFYGTARTAKAAFEIDARLARIRFGRWKFPFAKNRARRRKGDSINVG
jgi:hypothetical protein